MAGITIRFTPDPKQQLIDYILENYSTLENLCKTTNNPTDMSKCVECHIESYKYQGKPKYKCDNFKKIYLVRYFATQFAQCDFLIRAYLLTDIVKKSKMAVVSLGGGPSPELLALLNELQDRAGNYEISFLNLDGEPSWKTIYIDLANYFTKAGNIIVRTAFNSVDITKYVSTSKYDIVFIPWLLSEIDKRNRKQIIELARDITISKGFVIITDRSEETLISDISNIINKTNGITLEEQAALHGLYCGVSFPDNIAELFKVRLKSYANYWILRK